MDLTQFEWIKTELKCARYGENKVGCRDWKLPGTFLRKHKGIYIIMYINSRV
jgi:hypothetical protein